MTSVTLTVSGLLPAPAELYGTRPGYDDDDDRAVVYLDPAALPTFDPNDVITAQVTFKAERYERRLGDVDAVLSTVSVSQAWHKVRHGLLKRPADVQATWLQPSGTTTTQETVKVRLGTDAAEFVEVRLSDTAPVGQQIRLRARVG